MKRLTKAIIFFPVIFCSCSHYYYLPNAQNVPLFREKNEYRLSGAYGNGDESSSFEVQAAYSITDKIGVMTNFMSARGGKFSGKDDWGKGKLFEGAIGYFEPVKNHGVFELYAGIGGSNQHHNYVISNYVNGTVSNSFIGKSDISFVKLFIQPSFGITFNSFDVALSGRISRISFSNVENNINGNIDLYNEVNALSDKSHYYFEPAVTARVGWQYVKLQFQAQYSGYLNRPRLYFGEEYHISVGLYVSIAGRYKKDIPKKY